MALELKAFAVGKYILIVVAVIFMMLFVVIAIRRFLSKRVFLSGLNVPFDHYKNIENSIR
jgi:hypothetical protein